ncbi:hypothetical protein [Devosia sp.]|uniref:hypothetical protein n=1 Tax=Devosia sp. TaxID=1871048 RepID=UPI002AFE0204|nr:hypothetical protein [Devosia sp.]
MCEQCGLADEHEDDIEALVKAFLARREAAARRAGQPGPTPRPAGETGSVSTPWEKSA